MGVESLYLFDSPSNPHHHGGESEGEADAITMGEETEARLARVISERVADCHLCFVHSKDDARLCATFAQLFILPSVQRHHANGLDHMAQKLSMSKMKTEREATEEDEESMEGNGLTRCRLLREKLLSPPYNVDLGLKDEV